MKRVLTAAALALTGFATSAEVPRAVPTFECLGLYWKPTGGGSDNLCSVQYRIHGTADWREASPLWFDATDHPKMAEHSQEYRGSIVGLRPGTTYDVRLHLAVTDESVTLQAATWNDDFPIARTVRIPADAPQPYVISEGGSSAGYVLYTQDAGGVLDGGGTATANVVVNASFVIVRGLALRNAQNHGMQLGEVQDVVVDDCDISGWGRTAGDCPFGVNLDSAIYSNSKQLERIVVQKCRLHHPRSNSNAWTQSRPHDGKTTSHPIGPQGISFVGGLGRYVIRNNRIWSDDEHKFNDGMGETNNFSYAGFPNRDSDVYGNDISHAYDDGAEIEGADMNVRVWSNRFSEVYGAVGSATSSLGPLYIWRNVMASSRKGPANDADANKGAYLVKLGNENPDWGHGSIFVYHNTMLQPPARPGFTGSSGGGAGLLWTSSTKRQDHVVTRNNILFVRSGGPSVRDTSKDPTNRFDYDLFNGGISGAPGIEAHGIHGVPVFASATLLAAPLVAGSPGWDAGVRIPNFNDDFAGSAPDMGAFESPAGSVPRPAAPTAPPSAQPPVSATPTFSQHTDPGATVRICDRGVQIGQVTTDGTGSWTWTVPAPLRVGNHSITFTVEGPGGISDPSPVLDYPVTAADGGAPAEGASNGPSRDGGDGVCGAGSTAMALLALAVARFAKPSRSEIGLNERGA